MSLHVGVLILAKLHKLNLKLSNLSKREQSFSTQLGQLLPPTELFLHSAWVCRAILLSDCMKTSFEKLINLFILLQSAEKKYRFRGILILFDPSVLETISLQVKTQWWKGWIDREHVLFPLAMCLYPTLFGQSPKTGSAGFKKVLHVLVHPS